MWVESGLATAIFLGLTATTVLKAQSPPLSGTGQNGARRASGFVPGRERLPGDPVQIARGKALYGIDCTGCHGADLRGGDLGGPNLLRSQLALSDQDGELILPIIQGSRQSQGMPAIDMSREDGLAVASYVRSIVATIGRQGMPPSVGQEPPSVLVGDARAGQSYFDAKCNGCHSPTGDLKGIASRIPDAKALQNRWVAGGGGRRGGGGSAPPPINVTITQPSGEKVDGRLIRIDDFLVTIALADATVRSIRRDGDVPNVDLHDPMKRHRDLLSVYTDQDMHDVTAYLVTLK
jgi:cytochrome c oxidase cbb3-type subunit III